MARSSSDVAPRYRGSEVELDLFGISALMAERPGLRHLDSEVEQGHAAGALRSAACELERFGGVGLVEPFWATHIAYVPHGRGARMDRVLVAWARHVPSWSK